jgi:hypothetical protein
MENKPSSVDNGCIEKLSKINENKLDISRIDKIQIRTLKQINSNMDKLNKEKMIRLCIDYQLKFVSLVVLI